jgi:AraC family transcriptional regulator
LTAVSQLDWCAFGEGPGLSVGWNQKAPAGEREHCHATAQILVVLEPAKCEIEWWTCGGERLHRALRAGDIWVVPPGIKHAKRWQGDAGLLLMHLQPEWVDRFGKGLVSQVVIEPMTNFALYDPLIGGLTAELVRERDLSWPRQTDQLVALGHCLVARLLQGLAQREVGRAPVQRHLGTDTMARVTSFVEANLGEKFSLAALAHEARLSPSHFSVLFKATMGMTTEQYILRSRLLRAKGLIVQGAYTVGQVAHMTGFADHSHLSVQFKRFFGAPPKSYLPPLRTV